MEIKLDDEIFEGLLYMSRLTATEEESRVFIEQIKKVMSDMDVLHRYLKDLDLEAPTVDETALRDSEIQSGLDARMLKKNSSEFLDGYFRVPKILENS